jgi:S-formylglutathione hydrolase FrmB
VGAMLASMVALAGTVASAAPAADPFPGARPSTDGSHIERVVRVDKRRYVLYVYSAVMRRAIGMQVIRPADTGAPAPTLYLLNGAEDGRGPRGLTTWETKTDIVPFMADKQVNVVTLIDGAYSYYSDWIADDPVLGRNKWTTFLTTELPSVLDSAFRASGRNAIVGVSMSATSALQLAEAAPGVYSSVGSFSGCDQINLPPCEAVVQAVLRMAHADPDNMWGPMGGRDWVANDPTTPANLRKLRGVNVVIAAGSGAPGPHDTGTDTPRVLDQVVIGGGLESVASYYTRQLQTWMAALRVPATFLFLPFGTHSWLYWQDDLHAAWPSFARSLGLSGDHAAGRGGSGGR